MRLLAAQGLGRSEASGRKGVHRLEERETQGALGRKRQDWSRGDFDTRWGWGWVGGAMCSSS